MTGLFLVNQLNPSSPPKKKEKDFFFDETVVTDAGPSSVRMGIGDIRPPIREQWRNTPSPFTSVRWWMNSSSDGYLTPPKKIIRPDLHWDYKCPYPWRREGRMMMTSWDFRETGLRTTMMETLLIPGTRLWMVVTHKWTRKKLVLSTVVPRNGWQVVRDEDRRCRCYERQRAKVIGDVRLSHTQMIVVHTSNERICMFAGYLDNHHRAHSLKECVFRF